MLKPFWLAGHMHGKLRLPEAMQIDMIGRGEEMQIEIREPMNKRL